MTPIIVTTGAEVAGYDIAEYLVLVVQPCTILQV